MQLPQPKTHQTRLSLDCKLSLARCYNSQREGSNGFFSVDEHQAVLKGAVLFGMPLIHRINPFSRNFPSLPRLSKGFFPSPRCSDRFCPLIPSACSRYFSTVSLRLASSPISLSLSHKFKSECVTIPVLFRLLSILAVPSCLSSL